MRKSQPAQTTADDRESEVSQLPYLETFSKAAELNSFTAAAKVLCVSQASVSQRVQALEKSLGTPLFMRRGGRVLLTEAGQKVYSYAQRILDLHREMRRELTGHAEPLAGELLLAASSVPGEHLLPALLSVFGRNYPHIRVRATVTDSMSVITQVEHGEVNVGLAGSKADKPCLEFRHLASDQMVLVVPAGHVLAGQKKVTLQQVTAQPLILRESGSGLRQYFEKALEQAGRSQSELRVGMELGSNEAIKEAVLRGAGVAVMSSYAVHKELKTGQLVALEIGDLLCERDMFILWDKRRALPLPARLFLTFLESNPIPGISSSV
jgi:DNA-binding transcriptional LysR family regulator